MLLVAALVESGAWFIPSYYLLSAVIALEAPRRKNHPNGWGILVKDHATTTIFLLINTILILLQCGGTRRRVLMIGLWNRMWHRDVTATQWRTFVLSTANNAVARRARRQQVERQNGYFGLQFGGWLNKMAHFPLVFTRADAEPASVFMHGALVLRRYFEVHLHNMDLPNQKWKLSFSAHLEYWHSE
jgi:hypothetical protein